MYNIKVNFLLLFVKNNFLHYKHTHLQLRKIKFNFVFDSLWKHGLICGQTQFHNFFHLRISETEALRS